MAERSPLLTLPVETLTAIFVDLLPNRSDFLPDIAFEYCESTFPNEATLRGVAHTCRRLREVAIPLLYQHVTVDQGHDCIRLLRYFSRFPGYGGLVRELVVVSDPFLVDRLSTWQLAFLFAEARRQGIQALVSEMDGSYPVPALLLALLLRQTPNIQKLGMEMLPKAVNVPGMDFAARLPGSFMLDSLRHLDIRTCYADLPPPIQPLATFLRHAPALASLRVGYYRAAKLSTMIETPQPQLKELHLLDTSPEDLADIVRLCPRLERCRFGLPGFPSEGEESFVQSSQSPPSISALPPFTVGAILKGLLPLAATLRELYLDWPSVHGFGKQSPMMKDLDLVSHFGALRCLCLGLAIWPEGDATKLITELPRGIESLSFGGRDFPINNIAHLLSTRVRAGRLPKLKSYRYTLYPYVLELEEPEPEVPDKVAMAFEGTGVVCKTAWLTAFDEHDEATPN